MRNLVIGAGFSGAIIANLIASKLNQKVLIIDKRNHLAGNCYDYLDDNGIMIQKYGSHIFHTNNDQVWNFLNKYSKFNNYIHKVLVEIDRKKFSIPFDFSHLDKVFLNESDVIKKKLLNEFNNCEQISIFDLKEKNDDDLKRVYNYIYEKIFKNYSFKQWGVALEEVDKTVLTRIPIYLKYDNKYFQDKYQGVPLSGYTKLIEKILNHENIEIRLNSQYEDLNEKFDKIFCTSSIDEFFNYEFGVLKYRSLDFVFEEHNQEYYQENSVINYPNENEFTRIHEFKYYLNDKSDKTIIAKEYPKEFKVGKNERFYPFIDDENAKLYKKYLNKAKNIKNLHFLGRLGDYRYYDIDKAISRAFELFRELYL